MQEVNVRQAKTHLSRLVDKAVKGEAFIMNSFPKKVAS